MLEVLSSWFGVFESWAYYRYSGGVSNLVKLKMSQVIHGQLDESKFEVCVPSTPTPIPTLTKSQETPKILLPILPPRHSRDHRRLPHTTRHTNDPPIL